MTNRKDWSAVERSHLEHFIGALCPGFDPEQELPPDAPSVEEIRAAVPLPLQPAFQEILAEARSILWYKPANRREWENLGSPPGRWPWYLAWEWLKLHFPVQELTEPAADDVDRLLDPTYSVTDLGQRVRDSLRWVADQFERVVEDTPNGPVLRWDRASRKPPTELAVTMLRTFARDQKQRLAMIARLAQLAARTDHVHAEDQTTTDAETIDALRAWQKLA